MHLRVLSSHYNRYYMIGMAKWSRLFKIVEIGPNLLPRNYHQVLCAMCRKPKTKFLISQQCNLRSISYGAPKLTPQEVNEVLRANESTQEIETNNSIRAFETNQLPSNDPIEDRLAIARCLLTTGIMFGVFDGHGGHLCSEITSQRLLDYLALAILPHGLLQDFVSNNEKKLNLDLTEFVHEVNGLSNSQQEKHKESLLQFTKHLLNKIESSNNFNMQDAVAEAFQRYDNDLSREVQEGIRKRLEEAMSLAVMGCCACIGHIDGHHLHIAASGDCKAVLGVLTEENTWTAVPLSKEHNTDNVEEINRVIAEHPKSESNVIFKNDRLLGCLAPLRAFGDFNFKWKSSLIKDLLVPIFGPQVMLANYYTPPYLTAKPEIIHHKLRPKDRFLVIASDGLWEQLMPHKVVKLVGEHMSGKQVLDLLKLPQPNMTLGAINNILLQRRDSLAKKPTDANAATHLIRTALGWTESGIEHGKLSTMLSLPKTIVRNYRDDMTIIIIFFNSEFLRNSPG